VNNADQPAKTGIAPRIASEPLDSYIVTDVHMRPLFTTTIRLPEAVTSIAVGAPTLFFAEHSDDDPRLVFVKPSTHDPAESNLLIALQSGETISLRLISPGDAGSRENVDFVIDYRSGKRLLTFSEDMASSPLATADALASVAAPLRKSIASALPKADSGAAPNEHIAQVSLDGALTQQAAIAAPVWLTSDDLRRITKANAQASDNLAISVGRVVQAGDSMMATYSILNVSNQWVQVLPPQIQLANPTQKKSKKKGVLAEQVPIQDFRLTISRLPPGARADGVVRFARPGFKQNTESLLLQLATASAVDKPLLIPILFVAPGS
jgi:hypothetical protein